MYFEAKVSTEVEVVLQKLPKFLKIYIIFDWDGKYNETVSLDRSFL